MLVINVLPTSAEKKVAHDQRRDARYLARRERKLSAAGYADKLAKLFMHCRPEVNK